MLDSDQICTCCESELDKSVQLKMINRATIWKKLPVLMCSRCEGPAFMLAQRTDESFFDLDNPENNINPPETV